MAAKPDVLFTIPAPGEVDDSSTLRAVPDSMKSMRDQIARGAQASLQQGIPGLQFGVPSVPGQGQGLALDIPPSDGGEVMFSIAPSDPVPAAEPVPETAPPEDKSNLRQFAGGLVGGVRKGFGALSDQAVRAAKWLADNGGGYDSSVMDVSYEEYRKEYKANQKQFDEDFKAYFKQAATDRQEFSDKMAGGQVGPDSTWGDRWSRGVGDSIGYMTPTLAAAVLTGGTSAEAQAAAGARGLWSKAGKFFLDAVKDPRAWTGAAIMGTQTYADSKTQYETEGLDDTQSTKLAFVDAAAETIPEIFGLHALFGPSKSVVSRMFKTTLAEVPGEHVTSLVQNFTGQLGKMGNEPTQEQVAEAWDKGIQDTIKQAGDTTAVTVLQSLLLGGVTGGMRRQQGETVLPAAKPAAAKPIVSVPPTGAATVPPPVSGGAATAPAVAPPAAAPAPLPGTAPPGSRVAMYAPADAKGRQTPVQVSEVKDGMATVTSLDDEGQPIMVDGEPATYQVSVADLYGGGFQKGTAPGPVSIAPKSVTPITPEAVAPAPANTEAPPTSPSGVTDAPSAEPVRDIQAQLADMRDPATPRQGVFLSAEAIKHLRKIKQDGILAGLPKDTNWDYAGGTMIFPTAEARDAAVAAKQSIKKGKDAGVARQQLTGKITGVAVLQDTKPTGPAVAVQAKTPAGAVVRETLVAPEAVSKAETVLAEQQPGTVITTATPQQVQEQRAAGVQADQQADGWQAFGADSGTLGVPRAEMPQVKAEHRGALVNFLKARGVESTQGEVAAGSLKPTQAEFSPAKVQAAKDYSGGNRSILVSSDGHVVDGHHQWLAAKEAGERVAVTRLSAPIKDLLPVVREFPSTGTSSPASSGDSTAAASPAPQPASTTPAKPGGVEVTQTEFDLRKRLSVLEALRKCVHG